MTIYAKIITLAAVLVALAAGASVQAQTREFDALRARAEQGEAEAQYELGCLNDVGCLDESVLSKGLDLEIDALDDAEAARWYRLAAEQGHAAAQSRLGDFHEFGYGVSQDYAEAVRWHRSAAEQGGAEAQFNLGVRYSNGRGVPQDDVQAHMWFNLAASRMAGGHRQHVVDGRDRAAGQMNPTQIAEAGRLAREWDAAHPRDSPPSPLTRQFWIGIQKSVATPALNPLPASGTIRVDADNVLICENRSHTMHGSLPLPPLDTSEERDHEQRES